VQAQRGNDNTREKCRRFLTNLLELSSREPKAVERNVRTLIQELIDSKVEPEEFCDRLERLLNASPQPCLIGFLKVQLFYLFILNTFVPIKLLFKLVGVEFHMLSICIFRRRVATIDITEKNNC